jgi:starch synthase
MAVAATRRRAGPPLSWPKAGKRLRVLHASAELHPLVKTGGLADVAAALPAALAERGLRVELVLPAYRQVREGVGKLRQIATMFVRGWRMKLLRGRHPDSGLPLTLIDAPELFDRDGDPYHDAHGRPFDDNAIRFGVFSEAVAALAAGGAGSAPRFDIVHLHDWQIGLAALHLVRRVPSVFTIHNLAYQGLFPRPAFDALGLDPSLWRADAIEALGYLSFMKAGLTYADAITTVSPQYAREILTPDFGAGLQDLLQSRVAVIEGICNGIDTAIWDPATDLHLEQRYDARSVMRGKEANKRALQAELGLKPTSVPMLAFVGRFAHQKGADGLLAILGELVSLPLQVVVLGAGDRDLERAFHAWGEREPARVAVRTTMDERLAHRIEAGADLFLMPSRYEPCGLSQMYSQRYGTVPLVRRVGGLVDTVVDAAEPGGSGIIFERDDVSGLAAVQRALGLMADTRRWLQLQRNGMRRDFSWSAAAERYLDLYERLQPDRSRAAAR